MEAVDIRLEAVILPHLDGEEVMAVFLGILARGILSEERFDYLLEVTERVGRPRVELIRCRTFQTGGEGDAQEWIFAGIDHHFVSEIPNVLDGVAYSGVTVES